MEKTIILRFDAELLRAAEAVVEEGRSLSDLLADQLATIVRERRRFTQAREHAVARLRQGIDLGWAPARSRHDVHAR